MTQVWFGEALSLATALACGLLIGIQRGFTLRQEGAGVARRRRADVHFARAGAGPRRTGWTCWASNFTAGALDCRRGRGARRRLRSPAGVGATPGRDDARGGAGDARPWLHRRVRQPGPGDRWRDGGHTAPRAQGRAAQLIDRARRSTTSRRSPAMLSSPARSSPSSPTAIMARSARGTRRSCGWSWCSSPAFRSSAISPTGSSASGMGPSPRR